MKRFVGGGILFVIFFFAALGCVALAQNMGVNEEAIIKIATATLVGLAFLCAHVGAQFYDWCAAGIDNGDRFAPRLFVKKEQRICLIIAVAGALVMLAGIIGFGVRSQYSFYYLGDDLRTLFLDRYRDDWFIYAARGGALTALVFGALSVAYQFTIGPLIRWVRSGQ